MADDKPSSPELDKQLLDEAVIEGLTGASVHVTAGTILHDEIVKPLTRTGAEDVLDRLRARGFKVTRT